MDWNMMIHCTYDDGSEERKKKPRELKGRGDVRQCSRVVSLAPPHGQVQNRVSNRTNANPSCVSRRHDTCTYCTVGRYLR